MPSIRGRRLAKSSGVSKRAMASRTERRVCGMSLNGFWYLNFRTSPSISMMMGSDWSFFSYFGEKIFLRWSVGRYAGRMILCRIVPRSSSSSEEEVCVKCAMPAGMG